MEKELIILKYQDNFADNLSSYAYGKILEQNILKQLRQASLDISTVITISLIIITYATYNFLLTQMQWKKTEEKQVVSQDKLHIYNLITTLQCK